MADNLAEVIEQSHLRFREVQKSDKTIALDRTKIPWLPQEQKVSVIPLALVTRHSGEQFYIGNAIRGCLVEIASHVKSRLAVKANKLFYAGVERLLDEGGNTTMDKVSNATTAETVYYVKNREGIRVYFFKLSTQDGKAAIIRIAVCHSKGMEEQVYRRVCTDSAKQAQRVLYR